MYLSRRRLLYGSTGLAVTAVAGCSSDEESAELTGFTGISMPTTTSERWVIEGEALENMLIDAGYDTILEYGEDEIEAQIEQIQGMIDDGVEFLIIAAIDNQSLGEVLATAKDRGVTIISYDRLILQTPDVDYYASFDNYRVGVLQATHILDRLSVEENSGPFNVEVFSGSPDDSNSQYFFQGGMDTFERYMYEGTINIRSGETEQEPTSTLRWDGVRAKDRMTGLLEDHYEDGELHAVLSPYDGISRGVVAALEEAGYIPGTADFPIVTGQDAEAISVKAIRDETGQTQTVFKDTRDLAEVAFDMVKRIVDGGSPEVNDLGTYDNGFKFVPSYLLEPVNVDASNWEEVLVESDYLSEDEIDEAEEWLEI
ncbi:substrate-binding domain-containing protein [Glycomyces xiaoerkulensis]|uniref:substrate-binding domain-containing protein n=1 Tax=Glycomyces xiaoerkulensis TaxID=2038139 RepID=UPI000C25C800|nr:sugar-binding protein [Glycomyces xiaoerkulensis]